MDWLTIIAIISIGVNIYQFVSSQSDKAYIKSSIRVWQHGARGIADALQDIVWGTSGRRAYSQQFTKVSDVGLAANAVRQSAESMANSLYESRFFTDAELKKNIQEDEEKYKLKDEAKK